MTYNPKWLDPIAYAWEHVHGTRLPENLRERRWQLIEGRGLTERGKGCELPAHTAEVVCPDDSNLAHSATKPRQPGGALSFLE